jgi:hypothetical protein
MCGGPYKGCTTAAVTAGCSFVRHVGYHVHGHVGTASSGNSIASGMKHVPCAERGSLSVCPSEVPLPSFKSCSLWTGYM